MTDDLRVPVIVLTGFLGSGKTTLLHQLMQRAEWQDTAVIVNELGEVGLDHLLVQHVAPNVQVLPNGCVCCSVSEDLTRTLADLHARRQRGEIRFNRVVVETTGLADPMPLLHTLATHEALARQFRMEGVAVTVDACNGTATLQRHEEARRQVAMADTLLLTKTDLAGARDLQPLAQQLARINASASLRRVVRGELDSEHLFHLGHAFLAQKDRLHAPRGQRPGWLLLGNPGRGGTRLSAPSRQHLSHASDITTECFAIDEPVQGAAFSHWLELLAALRGEQMLRFKGLIHIAEDPERPRVVHAAQHLIHPPESLPAWPGADRRSLLVFITQGMEPGLIARTLSKFTGALPIPSHP